MKLNIRYIG